jgi:hypothetical protein
MSYDFNDRQVAALVSTTHFPIEFATNAASPPTLILICAKCQNPWPCATINDYRTWLAANPQLAPNTVAFQGSASTQRSGEPLPPALPQAPVRPLGP